MIKRFRRLLKFALSRKTRNRSRASKEAWARRKNFKNFEQVLGNLGEQDTAMQAPERATVGAVSPAVESPAAVPDAESARLESLEWPAPGKDYGLETFYKDRDGVIRVRQAEAE